MYKKNKKPVLIFNLGSGPGRDISEVLKKLNKKVLLNILMMDQDDDALNYSKNLLASFADILQFKKVNLLRIVAGEKYNAEKYGKFDVISCIGLFDYLDENKSIRLSKSLYLMLNPGGKLVISNWNISNPSRTEMEWVCDWFVCHRTKEEMLKILKMSQIPIKNLKITKDPSGHFHIGIITKN